MQDMNNNNETQEARMENRGARNELKQTGQDTPKGSMPSCLLLENQDWERGL